MAALALGKIGGFLTKSFLADQALDLVTGRKNKKNQPPTKETWKNYMGEKGEKPASEQTIDVEVLGKETVGANANDLGTFTKAPEDPKPESTGNEDSIVAQINKINSNISAISNAMQSSADIEEEYRKNLKEDLEQDIADRDKLQAKKRAENRRDSFRKNLLSGPKKVAGVAGSALAKGLGLEALAALFPTEEERKDRIKKTLVGDDTKPKPEGFMRGLAGIADFVTGDLTDFDNRGVIGSEINASILENRDKKDDKTDKTIKDKNKASEFIGGKNETTNETINEINNNTTNTNNNSTNQTTKVNEKTIKGDLTTITSDGKTFPRGLSGPMETFGGKGGSTYTQEEANAVAEAFDNQPVYQLQKLRSERSALERGPDGKIKDRKRWNEIGAEIRSIQNQIIVSRGGTPKPIKKKGGGFGLKRMIGGAADQLTGNLFDFDKRSGGGLLRKTAGAVGGVARGIGRGLKRGIGGALDFATLGMFDFDKRNRKGAPKGFGLKRIMGGLADAATGGLTDFDKRGAGLLQVNPLFGGKDKAWGKEPGTRITTNNFSDSVKYTKRLGEIDPNSLEPGVPIEKAQQHDLQNQIRMLEYKKRRTKGDTSAIDKQLNALKIKYNNTLEFGGYNVKATPQNTSVPTDPKKTPKVVNVPSSGAPSGENNTGSPGGGTVNVSGNSGGGPTIAFPPSHNGVSYAAVETQSQMNLVMAD